MALAKRAAKRVAPKTKEEKDKAISKIYKEIEQKEEARKQVKAQKKREIEKTLAWLKAKEDRIKQIEDQRNHLLSQQKYDNPYRGAMLVEYKTEAKTDATLKARGGKSSEGKIMSEKKYNELLKRNKIILDKKVKDSEASNLYQSFSKQRSALSKAGLGEFTETYDKVVDYIRKKHNKGKIDYAKASNLMNQIGDLVEHAIKQNNLLYRIKSTENLDLHSRVISKILVDFIKKRDYPEMIRTMNMITKDIQERRGFTTTLYELDRFYK